MAINMARLRARVESLAKAVSEKIGVKVNINTEGANNTDTESVINVADPEYYSMLYTLTEEGLVVMSLYASIHEAGHIAYTDVYDGKKDAGRAIRYILKKKPKFATNKAFNLLNMLEDYRMMEQLAYHREGVSYYTKTACDIVGNENVSIMHKKGRTIDYIDFAMLKLYAPDCLDNLNKDLIPKNESKLKRVDRMIADVKALSPKHSTTMDCAELVLKYYTLFYGTIERKPSREPDIEISESGGSKGKPKEGTPEESKDSKSEDSKSADSKSETAKDIIAKDIEKEINGLEDSKETELEKSTNRLKDARSKGVIDRALDKAHLKFEDSKIIGNRHFPLDSYRVKKFSEVDKHANDEFNGTELHAPVPSVYVEPILKMDNFHTDNIGAKWDNTNISKAIASGKKLASKLENVVKVSDDAFVTGTKSGTLNVKSLHKHSTSNRLFKKRVDSSDGDLCVYILLDASGSMYGKKDKKVLSSAISIHTALKTLGVKHRFLSFFTKSNVSVTGNDGDYFTAYCNNIVEVGNNSYFDAKSYNGWGNNRDGLALRLVNSMLMKEPESNKVLIVISDGQPACAEGYSSFNGKAVKDTVAAIKSCRKMGVSVTGMYIANMRGSRDHDTIKSMYGQDYASVFNEKDIEYAVASVIKRAVKNIT